MNDPQLLANIAILLHKTPIATWKMIERNSSKQLRDIDVVKAIADYTNLSQEEILSPINVEA